MNVYISSDTKDKGLARTIGDGLRRSGFHVWDPSEIFPGDNWGAKIGEALEVSNAMIVLLTPNSVKSPNVRSDISFAISNLNYENRVIPVVAAPPLAVSKEEIPWVLTLFPMVQLDGVDKDFKGLQQIVLALNGSPN